jgi:hypothetical protein
MSPGSATKSSGNLSETQQITRDTGTLLAKKIWLPKSLYAALPYFYLFAGASALLATLYIGNWYWVLPHYLFFSAGCLHMGITIYRRRSKSSEAGD